MSTVSAWRWWFSRMRWRFFLSFAGLGRVLAQLFKALFTLLSFSSQTKKGEPLTYCIQMPLTKCMKSNSLAHSGLNLKGIGPRSSWNTSSSLMGLWLEVLHGRIWTIASNPSRRKDLWSKNLSNLVAMWPWPILLLVQVYLPEIGLMSSGSQSCIRSSAHSLVGSWTLLPPVLSADKRVRLSSPAMMVFSRLTISAWVLMESQQAFFSTTFIGMYMLKTLMISFESKCYNFKNNQWVLRVSEMTENLLAFQRVPNPPKAP